MNLLGGKVQLLPGDCREVMATLSDASVDAIVCDPPYGLGFMGRAWDAPDGAPFAVELWQHALRVLKPGGHVVAFSGTRTYHRMVTAIEDAGFEIRDQLAWLYGSGFPKSLDVSKAIDKANGKHERDLAPFGEYVRACREAKGWSLRQLDDAMGTNTAASWWEGRKAGVQPPGLEQYRRLKMVLGMDDRFDSLVEWLEAEREVVGGQYRAKTGRNEGYGFGEEFDITAPATDAARQWQGWGTALKPSWEPICLARRPLIGTVAQNVLTHSVGALNVDACRIATDELTPRNNANTATLYEKGFEGAPLTINPSPLGRWPANLLHDGSEEVTGLFPETTSGLLQTHHQLRESDNGSMSGKNYARSPRQDAGGDSGSAARFFASFPRGDGWHDHHGHGSSHAPASAAASNINLQSEAAASALRHVVATSAAGLSLNSASYRAPSTIVTASAFAQIEMLLTETIQSFARRCSLGPPPERLSLSDSLASIAATHAPTGITTITISLSKSSGLAGPVTFEVIATNAALGASGSPQPRLYYTSKADADDRLGSSHPTVKPVDLMQWLCRLVCPKGGVVLDPFAGTGTTGEAAWREGMRAILIEREPEYQADIARRMDLATQPTKRAAVAATKNKLDDPNTLPLFAGAAE
jgi:DNA modification methylase/transcriptional regulator with XRE-family HTH domain